MSIRVVRPTFQNQLLFVNDTRYALDQGYGTDSLRTAIGEWPCEAELDTFFYARGGVPWKFYPPGTLSSPGIFSGYPMDTVLTTKFPGDLVPLALLAKYQHVVWFSNATAGFGVYLPSLQYMSSSGHSNSLATYVRMGGKAWLMGGGGARATLLPVNSRTNDVGGATVFSPALNELVPGRFMYDLVHWQSEISALVSIFANRNPSLPSGPGVPDYSGLPAQLRYRTEATDPLPPFRGTEFYPIGYDAEYLSKPNNVTELVPVTDDSSYAVSVLDTMYFTNGTSLGSKPVMTVYRGHDNPPFVFSGFPLWYFSRAQAMAVGDWVLNTFWGIPRADLPRDPATAAAARVRRAPRP